MTNSVPASRQQILKDSVKFLSANIIARGIEMIRSLVIAVLFSPAQLGIWNLMGVIRGYGANAHLGLLDGMNKAIPFLHGQGKVEEIEAIKDNVFWLNMLLGAFAGVAVCVASLMVTARFALSLQLTAMSVFLQMIFYYFYSLLRAYHRFELVSKGVALFSLLSTAFIVALAFALPDRLAGALIGLAIAFFFANAYWFVKGKYRFPFRLSLGSIRKALALGMPLIVIGVLNIVFLSVDRWVITANLSVTILGYYALGFMAGHILGLVPGSVASVLYPRMLERFAISQNPKSLHSLLIGPLRALTAIMLVLVCGAVLGLPLLIQLFLPKYLHSIPIIQILVPGAFFVSIANVAGTYIIAIDRQKWLFVVLITSTMLSLLLDVVLVRVGYGIIGVAWGTFIGYSFYGISYLVLAIYSATGQKLETARVLARLLIPYVAMVMAVVVGNIFVFKGSTPLEYVTSAGYKLALIASALLPTLWFVNRDGEVVKIVRTEFKTWLSARKG